jgi:DNA mismatch repair protein mutL
MQLDQSYIVAPSRDGLMIIDQHRAHVAILYARFMRRADDPEQYAPQGLLFGSELRLDARQEAVLQEALPQLESMGITLRRQGDGWAIASLPTMLGDAEAGDVILQTLDALQTDSDQYGRATTDCDTLRRRVALGLARSAAIHRGKTLSPHEMEKILSELLRLASPDTGPDGKRILLRLRMPDIGREFV